MGGNLSAGDGVVKISTDLDSDGLKNGLDKVGSSMGNLASGSLNLAKKGFEVLTGAIAGVSTALIAGATAGVKYNSTIEQYQTSFEVMTGSADKAKSVVSELQKLGADTPFEMTDLAETTQLLMNYGFTADDAINRMTMLGDISQGSADKMNRISTAYGQMSSAGKVQLEDVKQMIEAGFNPLQEISQSTGESMTSLYNRISKGTLSVDEITASMQRSTSEGGKYFQSMEKQSKTFNGEMSTLKDNAGQLLGTLTDGLQKNLAQTLLPQAIDAVNQLSDAFSTGGTQGLITAGTQIVSNFVYGIAQQLPSIIDTAVGVINEFITALDSNPQQILEAGANIVVSLVNGIISMTANLAQLATDLINQFTIFLKNQFAQINLAGSDTLTQFIAGMESAFSGLGFAALQLIVTLAQGIADSLPTLIPIAIQLITDLVVWILNNLPQIIDAGLQLILGLAVGIVNAIPQLIEKIPQIIEALVKGIITSLPEIIAAGVNLIIALGAGIISAIPQITMLIPDVINAIFDAFTSVDWADIGHQILNGIGDGFTRFSSGLVDKAKNTVGEMVDGVKDFLGIHSPSRLMRDEVGQYLPSGIGLGFEKGMPALTSDMIASMNDMVATVQAESNSMGTNIGSSSNIVSNIVNSSSATTGQTVNQYDFKGMNEGATYYVREEADIDKVATKLQEKTTNISRARGVVTV